MIETANYFIAVEAKQLCDDENNAKIMYLTPGIFTGERVHAVHYAYGKMPGVIVCIGSGKYDSWVSYYITGDEKTGLKKFVEKLKESSRV